MPPSNKPRLHPKLAPAVKQLKESQKQLELAEKKLGKAETRLVSRTAKHLGMNEEDLILGSRACTESPIGRCLYDDSDSMYDICLCCKRLGVTLNFQDFQYTK